MGTAVGRRPPEAQRFVTGPWKGVRTTTDPIDDSSELLADATNLYIPDPAGSSGAYARPGFLLLNGGAALVTSATPFRGQGVFSYTDLTSTSYNFVVIMGKLFRVDGQLANFTDVSPAGITIDPGITTRVYGTSFANQLIVTDGVNRPWLATNLASTPITGTYIDYDGSGTTWATFGPMKVYAGSVFCILSQYNSISRRTDISWSNPGDASTGWQQVNFDFNWTLEQTEADPLFALAPTNTQMYYFRGRSIGSISGTPGPNLSSQATHDAITQNIGTESPQSVVQFGTSVYFVDGIGRAYMLRPTLIYQQQVGPEPLWLNMRSIIDASNVGFPGVTKSTVTAAFEPTLNLYVVAIWSTIPSQLGPAVEAYAFDAKSATYLGRWKLGAGYQIETMGNFTDANGRGVLIILGSNGAPSGTSLAPSGFMWALNGLAAQGDYMTTEATPTNFLTTEDGVTSLVTEGTAANWQDNGVLPTISAQTSRMGYSANKVIAVDRATALVGTTAQVQVSMQNSTAAVTLEGTPTPSTTQDSISRLVCGASGIQGRGLQVTVSPQTATSQWSLQQIVVDAVEMEAPPDEV